MRPTALLALLAGCGDDAVQPTPDASPPPVGWSEVAAVPHGPIQETAAVGVHGKIYVLGGFDTDDGIVPLVQIYDTATGGWAADGPPMPRALHHINAATDGDTIYIVGALSGVGFTAAGDTYSLTPGGAWQTRASMPAGRERGASVTGIIGGKLYVAGGFRGGAATAFVDVYDPAADSWAPLADLPLARDHACGGVLDGTLVVAGGRNASPSGPMPDAWSYEPATNAWTPRAPMPTGRGGMACGVIDGALYTTGGEGNANASSGVFDQVESYAPDQWTQHSAMPHPKHGVGGAVWDGALYLCGGANVQGFGAVGTTDVFRP